VPWRFLSPSHIHEANDLHFIIELKVVLVWLDLDGVNDGRIKTHLVSRKFAERCL
jgi:hypothetical protein